MNDSSLEHPPADYKEDDSVAPDTWGDDEVWDDGKDDEIWGDDNDEKESKRKVSKRKVFKVDEDKKDLNFIARFDNLVWYNGSHHVLE